jgi:hypothetical protein
LNADLIYHTTRTQVTTEQQTNGALQNKDKDLESKPPKVLAINSDLMWQDLANIMTTRRHNTANEPLEETQVTLKIQSDNQDTQSDNIQDQIDILVTDKWQLQRRYRNLEMIHSAFLIVVAYLKQQLEEISVASWLKSVWESLTTTRRMKELQAANDALLSKVFNLEGKLASLEIKMDVKDSDIGRLHAQAAEHSMEKTKLEARIKSQTRGIDRLVGEKKGRAAEWAVLELFAGIGISIRHRALEWEKKKRNRNQARINAGNKMAHSSKCLADAYLYRHDESFSTTSSVLSQLRANPRTDTDTFMTFYGTMPMNIINLQEYPECLHMVDYCGAMVQLTGSKEYFTSEFEQAMKMTTQAIKGLTGNEPKEVCAKRLATSLQQEITRMMELYDDASAKHNQGWRKKRESKISANPPSWHVLIHCRNRMETRNVAPSIMWQEAHTFRDCSEPQHEPPWVKSIHIERSILCKGRT